MVQFRDEAPAQWRATRPDEFVVDSGNVCLMDAALCAKIKRRPQSKYESFINEVDAAMLMNQDNWTNIRIGATSGGDVVAFKTFDGDGTFPSFIGLSSNNKVVCVITDYFLRDCAIAAA